jgi:ubiquinone/menaquinone biosynthesis C-methylase UbiE
MSHALQFVGHDAQALPFATHSVDAIIANHMLYHMPNMPAVYAEFCRVLKPGGRLYAATISRDNMRELDASVSHVYPFRSQDRAAANPLVTGASVWVSVLSTVLRNSARGLPLSTSAATPMR